MLKILFNFCLVHYLRVYNTLLNMLYDILLLKYFNIIHEQTATKVFCGKDLKVCYLRL